MTCEGCLTVVPPQYAHYFARRTNLFTQAPIPEEQFDIGIIATIL